MKLLTIEDCGEITQFCRNTIKKAIKDGELKHGKFGRLIRVREEDLQEWIRRKIAGTMQSQTDSGVASADFQVIETIIGGHR